LLTLDDEPEDGRFFIEETTIYEIKVECKKEAKDIFRQFFEFGYLEKMPISIYHTETKLTNIAGEELDIHNG
jgi:hypothetical protein